MWGGGAGAGAGVGTAKHHVGEPAAEHIGPVAGRIHWQVAERAKGSRGHVRCASELLQKHNN